MFQSNSQFWDQSLHLREHSAVPCLEPRLSVFLLPELKYFSATLFFFLVTDTKKVTWSTLAFWFVSRARGNSLFTAGVHLALSSFTSTCYSSLSCPTLQCFSCLWPQLFMAHPFWKWDNFKLSMESLQFFLDLPSPFPAPGGLVLFVTKKSTQK